MKKKLFKFTKAQLKKLDAGKSVQLVKVPEGHQIKMCGDGIHYEIIKIK